MVSTRAIRKPKIHFSYGAQKASGPKSTFSARTHKTPKKKRAPRGSLLGSGIGSGKSNLWTLEERADLYNRRQKGEDWESICIDYPTRTRHAMQQQYSVEKRKHEGPVQFKITGRRGGRKPRAAQTRGHNWTSINKMPLTDEEEIFDDYEAVPMDLDIGEDDDDTEYEDVSHAAEESSHHPEEEITSKVSKVKVSSNPLQPALVKLIAAQPTRPPPLPRSATEPVKPGRKGSKKALFPNLPASAGLPPVDFEAVVENQLKASKDDQPEASKRKSSAVEVSETESRSSSHQSKRPKYSTEPSETYPAAPIPSEPTPSLAPKSPYPVLVFPDIVFSTEDLIKARERAKELSTMYEAERTSRKEAFEAAHKRATRRANDAEQRLIETGQEYAMKLKVEKAVIARELATLQEERDAAVNKLAETSQDLEAYKEENQTLKQAPVPLPESTLLHQQLATQESQLKLYDQLRTSLVTEAQKPRELSNRLKQESNEHNIQQSLLTASIKKLNDEFEDLSNKAIVKYVREIQQRNEELVKQRSVELEAYEGLMKALEAFTAPFAVSTSTLRSEEMATPVADPAKAAVPPEGTESRSGD